MSYYAFANLQYGEGERIDRSALHAELLKVLRDVWVREFMAESVSYAQGPFNE